MKNNTTKPLFGIVNFEDPGQPWSKVVGKYRLIKIENLEGFGDEKEHWLIDVEGEQCYVPVSSVQVLD